MSWEDAPSFRYYRSLQGAWLGPLDCVITSWRALQDKSTPKSAVFALAAMAIASRVAGRLTMATTLKRRTDREFLHTTRVSKWGATLFESTETITLEDDGRAIRMVGEQRSPQSMRAEPYESPGSIDETATRATYRIPWAGTIVVQSTHIVAEGLELSQETPWSLATTVLRREVVW